MALHPEILKLHHRLSELTLTSEHAKLSEETAEIAALHKHITDMELELARLKSTHPPEKVSHNLASRRQQSRFTMEAYISA